MVGFWCVVMRCSSYRYRPRLLFLCVVVVVISHIQRIGCQHEKTTLHGGQSRSWSAEQGKEKKNVWQHTPTPHLLRYSFGEKLKYKSYATNLQALRRSRSVSRPYMDSFGSSTGSKGVASPNSTLPCAITSFPVSLLLSPPGEV